MLLLELETQDNGVRGPFLIQTLDLLLLRINLCTSHVGRSSDTYQYMYHQSCMYRRAPLLLFLSCTDEASFVWFANEVSGRRALYLGFYLFLFTVFFSWGAWNGS
jgi:hypothetical protein